MKKRIFSILLFLIIAIALAACGSAPSAGNADNQAGANQIIDPQSDPLAFLEASGEKLRNADSFQMNIWHWMTNVRVRDPEPFTLDSVPTQMLYQMQYVSDLDGAPSSYLEEFEWTSSNEESQICEWHYLGDSVGYGGPGFEKYYTNYKHFSENGFTAKQRFWVLGSALDIGKDTLFAEFCELNPTVTIAEDGTTTIAAHLYYEQLRSLLNVELPMLTAHSSEILDDWSAEYFAHTKSIDELSLEFVVAPEGYLQHIAVKKRTRANGSAEYNWVSTARIISFSRVNEKLELDATDVSKNYLNDPEQIHYLVHHYHDEYQALYRYDSEKNVYNYGHIRKDMRDTVYIYLENENNENSEIWDYDFPAYNLISPPYHLLTEFNGFKVEAEFVALGSCFKEQLIIPNGVSFNYGYTNGLDGAYRKLHMVFFEDSEENAKITVRQIIMNPDQDISRTLAEAEEIWGEIPYYTDDLLEKFYYAGEWEYVDGVPTPIGE